MKKIMRGKSPIRNAIYLSMAVFMLAVIMVSFTSGSKNNKPKPPVTKDSVASVKAFMTVYKVLTNTRCMNCHPSGDSPLQGDDSHIHKMNVKRGVDGKGLYALRCSNCHQAQNTPGLHMPPGNPNWHLPAANMKMVFQGRTPRQLALQLLDPKQNGGRTTAQIIDHMANDPLVGWAWHPGDGRMPPPISRAQMAAQVRLWIAKGAFAPDAQAK